MRSSDALRMLDGDSEPDRHPIKMMSGIAQIELLDESRSSRRAGRTNTSRRPGRPARPSLIQVGRDLCQAANCGTMLRQRNDDVGSPCSKEHRRRAVALVDAAQAAEAEPRVSPAPTPERATIPGQ